MEVYCDIHSTKIIDMDWDKGCPIYVPPCEKCLKEARIEGRQQVFDAITFRIEQGGKK